MNKRSAKRLEALKLASAYIDRRRQFLLAFAMADAERSCSAWVPALGKTRSDAHYLDEFSAETMPPQEVVDSFLSTYGLNRMHVWDYQQTIGIMREIRHDPNFDPATQIRPYGEQFGLQQICHSRDKSTPIVRQDVAQTSAASKLAFFLRPEKAVFILDSNAVASAERRQSLHQAKSISLKSNDYKLYHGWCRSILEDETKDSEFKTAVDRLMLIFYTEAPPMNGVTRDFVERRLLDKLMFHEGAMLKRWKIVNGVQDEDDV